MQSITNQECYYSDLAIEEFELMFEDSLTTYYNNIKEEIERSIALKQIVRDTVNTDTMTIIWCGTLALLLNRLQRNPFAVTHIKYDMNERIKRLGVYYLCIDDLLL